MLAFQYGFNFDKKEMSISKNSTPILVKKQRPDILCQVFSFLFEC